MRVLCAPKRMWHAGRHRGCMNDQRWHHPRGEAVKWGWQRSL